MDFIAFDVETANEDFASICSIGIAGFKNGGAVKSLEYLINPCVAFSSVNVSIHGITPEMVGGAPVFADVLPLLVTAFGTLPVAHHTHFDRVAVRRAAEAAGLAVPDFRWIDTAKVVRRTWPQFAKSGYGLKNLSREFGIVFDHHQAAEDARCAGVILLKAMAESGLTLEQMEGRVCRPVSISGKPDAMAGNPEGHLFGEVACFTGALAMPRKEASALAAQLGCDVQMTVNVATTLLIVGDQGNWKLAGYEKSTKHRKAERLIAKGQAIRIIGEQDFERLIHL